jgi:anaerobic selenocysteine-containing dehydrogenase
MAAGGMYTLGGSFWEFGEPDWDRARYFLLFGVAEDHDSNPIKIGMSRLKQARAKIVSINPVKTGYSAIADEWIGIRPGTDGLFILALIHELLRADCIDLEYLVRYTNAPWLVIRAPGEPDDGLFARDAEGNPLAWDAAERRPVAATAAGIRPALVGEIELPDGRKAVPSFHLLAERYLDPQYGPEAVAERCGIPAETIRRIAAEIAHVAFNEPVVIDQPWTDWAGRRHERMVGRPIAMHAMRGISAHSNGFHTCRALHLLQLLLGAVDTPGSWRYKSPYPKSAPPGPKPSGKSGDVKAGNAMAGMPLGYPLGPEDLLVDDAGRPLRIDKAFSWDAPLAVHGMMHMVVTNAWKGDPYRIDTLFMYMANMAWNSSMNTSETMRMLSDKDPETGEYRIPFIVYCDAYDSEMVAYADLVLADTTYFERWDAISLLDRPIGSAEGPGDAIRHPVIKPDRDVRQFQEVLIELGARLGLPAFSNPDGSPKYPGGYPDYIINHERKPGIGPLAGWLCPTGASYKRAEDGIVLVNEELCIGCKLCSWACPYGAREFDDGAGVMKKCTLCIDRIYNENLQEVERVPACVMVCPVSARHFGDLGDPESNVSTLVRERGGYDLMPELGYRPTNKHLPPRPKVVVPEDPRLVGQAAEDAADGSGLLRWLDRILAR